MRSISKKATTCTDMSSPQSSYSSSLVTSQIRNLFLVWPSLYSRMSCFCELVEKTKISPRAGVQIVAKLAEDHETNLILKNVAARNVPREWLILRYWGVFGM